jgi:hypothetical protein
MSKSYDNPSSKPNQSHSKPQYNLNNYRQILARQNTPPRSNEGGSR